MSWLAAHVVEVSVLVVYLALMVWHGVEGKRASRRLVDFYVGGRAMSGVAIGLSFYSTYFSTNSFVGHAGRSYSVGFSWIALGVIVLACALLSWHVLAWRLRRFTEQLDSLTVPDFLGFRYQSRAVRLLSALVIVVAALFYVVAIFKGIAHVLEAYLDFSYVTAVIVVAMVVGAYTAAGGFIGVVKTDAVQALIMFAGSILLFFGLLEAGGGWDLALEKITALDEPLPDGRPLGQALLSREGLLPFGILFGLALAGGTKFLAEPRQLTRFYGIKDGRAEDCDDCCPYRYWPELPLFVAGRRTRARSAAGRHHHHRHRPHRSHSARRNALARNRSERRHPHRLFGRGDVFA